MKLAFAICAHREPELLNALINQILENDNCRIFIHIDQKSSIPVNGITNDPRVTVINERVAVEWGDFSHVESINALLREILADRHSYDYVTLLSGQDLLIRPVDQLTTYLANNAQTEIYMDISRMPFKAWGKSGGFNRILYKYPKFYRRKYNKDHPMNTIKRFYNKIFGLRLMPTQTLPSGIEFWGGSDWFTISGRLLQNSLNYIEENPWYDQFFSYSLNAAEVYYPTLYMHLSDREKAITDNNLKYIDWSIPERGSPKTFDLSDKTNLERSGQFFARKFSHEKDSEIIHYFVNKCTAPELEKV
ncbi:beta-1,6-N-acetylglucosaminyltransferase [Marinobacter salicampi]|uniref:beta-1,6-N-acetylglucosaminyltransferase n=1 Tax=Marinobacter salicampi TaxID=435907 RepID=UPI001408687E|nr:beta-1,6-N-acetylglucosaminyltransferase [Marinobacter salicampi]